jgi:prolyl-tRNA editing enzyme YbaK/EbsC (Cys-tRNA(Pro) deacylase)
MTLSTAAQRIQDVLAARGLPHRVVEFTQTTRSAADAAAAIGCTVAQIAKSIVFKAASGAPVLVIASGPNRVDEAKVAAAIGEPIGKADADFVREATGFAIGGVPPLGHAAPISTLIDRDLLALPTIWAAAGTPNAVFQLTPAELVGMTGGAPADIALRRS